MELEAGVDVMMLRAATAVAVMGMVGLAAEAQTSSKQSSRSNERMSCNELIQLQADAQRWDRVSRASPTTDTGWNLRVRRMVLLNESNEVKVAWDDARAVELSADKLDAVTAVVAPQNSVSSGSGSPWMPYFYRWVAAKPVKFYGDDRDCQGFCVAGP